VPGAARRRPGPELSVAPGLEPPWWLLEAPPDPAAPPLQGDAEADVAIVGGGYTGLWTALALAERDPALRIVVLEAAFAGHGPSGRNGGFLETYWCALARLRERVGDEDALALARASEGALAAVAALPDDVWLRQAGVLRVSASPAQDGALERGPKAARALGVPERAIPLTAGEVAERCRSRAFRRGVLFPDAATVQPARLVRALRRAALARGVRLHESTPVTAIRPGSLQTPRGRLSAPEIVVATNAWASSWRPLSRHLTNFGSYVVLTEPAPDRLAELGWTRGEAISDGRMFLHYFRTTADGRVLMGSGSGPIGWRGHVDRRFTHDGATAARAEAGLRRLLPGLAGLRVEHCWGGPVDVSADHLPFFGTMRGTRIHYGAGYSGNGVGPSWLGGQILASLVLGANDEWARLSLATRRVPSLPPEPLRRLGGGLIRSAILACEEAEDAGRRPNGAAQAVASLPRRLGLRVGTR
jgi:glycine/D-amino acid oxidase-like deaminating enzyme